MTMPTYEFNFAMSGNVSAVIEADDEDAAMELYRGGDFAYDFSEFKIDG
jgi:hypothetical protein